MLEPITGTNGWMRVSDRYMQGVRALCDRYGIMMISDEVMAGFGRTGPMFGFQNFEGVVPDMYTFAKGVSGSYIPLAGVGVKQEVHDFFKKNPLGYGSTYASHPVACAAGYATIKHMIENKITDHVQNVAAPVMQEEMNKLVAAHPSAKAGRVNGLGCAVEIGDGKGNFLMD